MRKEKETKKADNKIRELEAKIQELTAGWQRTQADFDNFRKRTEEEKQHFIHFANVNLITDLLPVLDNFQRSTEHIPNDIQNNNWVQGMKLVEKQLEDILTQSGLKKIAVKIGDQFNPQLHEAISCEKSAKMAENQILEIVLNGYTLSNKVIRPVKVKVCKDTNE